MILLNIEEVFQAIFVIVAGGLMFYLPALLLSFITGRTVRMGSRLFGQKVKSTVSLDQVILSRAGTSSTNQTSQQRELTITYVNWNNEIKTVERNVTVVLGKTIQFRSNMSGGVWVSDNHSVAVVDPKKGVVLGVAVGEAIISYAVGNKFAQVTVQVSPPRTLPTFNGGV